MLAKCFQSTFKGDEWVGTEIAIFGNCVLSSLTTVENVSAPTVDEASAVGDTLDVCLRLRGCFEFSNGVLNQNKLLRCIDGGSPCGSHVTSSQSTILDTCLNQCKGGALCTTGCFNLAGIKVSESFGIASSCLNALFLDPETEPEWSYFQAECERWADQQAVAEQEAKPAAASLFDVLLRGLPSLTKCATDQCQSPYRRTPVLKGFSCLAKFCMVDDPSLPCAFNCFTGEL